MQALQAAATGRRRAEAALLGSIAIGEIALVDLHPGAVGAIVRACARRARTRRRACSRSKSRSPTACEEGPEEKPAPARTREVEAFLEMLQAERGASQNTLAAYGSDLDNLQVFLARRKQKPAGADAEALRAYLKSLDYVGMTPRTVARRLSVMRQFFRFLLAERMRDDDPASTLDSPQLGRPLPKVLSRAEVDRLIEAARGQGRRRRAHGDACSRSSTARACACRSWSACRCRRSSAIRRCWWCAARASKERMVPLSDPARAAIAAWLHVRAGDARRGEKSR